ncbi:hypothetical protein [Mycolicibacterium goodii]|uniref:Uncharacterized protein n=1 Tax=Mycolicibacterium goodii TaxID=134601 RepID=A0ABS6HR91_MYCGD|nr:hypothetical protein [Mycolicibacterium goodii]OKH72596.1 hypothetical protein EB74_22910 [Mycobacterium sp. SWH-M5]MBU8825214.1 hypothetical protein [Mycolicibacterium goodii]MBU8828218.1 hypothetical protein [Mycolicibacterium goodii]MBU8838220.1 hypothetical protein [Mycolicibacterium goodii]PJK19990.1 hypothetical protein CSX11_23175 [Mycolicibacterium goodii]
MKKFGLAAIAASGLTAAILGLAGPAQAAPAVAQAPTSVDATTITAGVDRLDWLDKIQPKATAPQVDTTVRHSGR